jgi:hypothetical protein
MTVFEKLLDNYWFVKDINEEEYNNVKKGLILNWEDIVIEQSNNLDNISMDAGKNIEVACNIKLPNIECGIFGMSLYIFSASAEYIPSLPYLKNFALHVLFSHFSDFFDQSENPRASGAHR